MDTYSLADTARRLGTSPPRVRRAVDRLGLPVEQDASGVFHLTQEQVGELARELGVIPLLPGMSRIDAQVLAALSRSPRGVSSVREAARRAGVSPTAAGRALARLVAQGLITQTPIMLARGHASEVTVYQVRFGSDEWLALAPVVAKVQLPDHAQQIARQTSSPAPAAPVLEYGLRSARCRYLSAVYRQAAAHDVRPGRPCLGYCQPSRQCLGTRGSYPRPRAGATCARAQPGQVRACCLNTSAASCRRIRH